MTSDLIKRNGHRDLPDGTLFDFAGKIIRADRAPNFQDSWYTSYYGSGTGYGNYGANTTKNELIGWLWRGGDADADIGFNQQILRERSRDAFMGIPLAAGAIETLDTNVIGEGLFPAPAIDGEALGLDEAATAELVKEVADKWEWWANDPRECDYEAKHTFQTIQHIAFQSMLLSGDCPVLFPLKTRPNTVYDLRMRVLEGDRIRNPLVFDPNKNIFNGVELSWDGELQAYHITSVHPLSVGNQGWLIPPLNANVGAMPGQTFRVEPYGALTGRRNMVFLMRPERPEQRRGVPVLSVCLELLKQMGRYTDATVLGAVIQSYFTAFVTSEFPDPTIFDSLLTDDQKKQIMNLNPYNVQLGPGIVNFMRPGHAVNFAHPTQPQSTFGDFTIAIAKFVGSATGIPYEVLLKQYNSSYSASRGAMLDFWKRVRKHRALVVDQLLQPVYEEWMADAIGLGIITKFKGNYDDPLVRRAMTRCIWTGASAGSLDPSKEVAAADQKVRSGFSTIEREAQELNGSNYRDNIRQSALEQTEFEDAGLIYPPNRPISGRGSGVTALPPAGMEQALPEPAAQPSKETAAPSAPQSPVASAKPKRRKKKQPVELASGLSGRFER